MDIEIEKLIAEKDILVKRIVQLEDENKKLVAKNKELTNDLIEAMAVEINMLKTLDTAANTMQKVKEYLLGDKK